MIQAVHECEFSNEKTHTVNLRSELRIDGSIRISLLGPETESEWIITQREARELLRSLGSVVPTAITAGHHAMLPKDGSESR